MALITRTPRLTVLAQQIGLPHHMNQRTCCCRCSKMRNSSSSSSSTRAAVAVGMVSFSLVTLLFGGGKEKEKIANGFDLTMVVPGPSIEEVETGIKEHAQSLLNVKSLLESESWREAQKQLRKSSSNLKLDIYTIIQNKPPNSRPLLRSLYSTLFNSVTKLEYAARDKDPSRVQQCYQSMVLALNNMLSRI